MRGMTVAELADALDVKRQTVYKYENCTVIPSIDIIDKIIDTLNFPLPFLTTQTSLGQAGNQVIHFRDMKTNTAKIRSMARNWLLTSYEVISTFEKYLDLPPVNLPSFDIQDFSQLTYTDIDILAERTRRHWGIGDGPISDVTLLLENNGIIVVRKDMETDKLEACSVLQYGRPCILTKTQRESSARDILNLAHELGHLVMHQEVSDEDMSNANIFKLIESQAWRFARAFLLPPATFVKELGYPTLSQYLLMKRRWRVSIQAMIMHSYALGVIDDERRQYFYRELSRNNFRKQEPLDSEIEIEKSRMLLECAQLIEQEGIATRDEMFQQTNLSEWDYIQIIGAPKDYLEPVVRKPKLRIVN